MMVKAWGTNSPTPILYILLYISSFAFLFILLKRKTSVFLAFLFLAVFVLVNIVVFNNFHFSFTSWEDLPGNSLYRLLFLCLPLLFAPCLIKSYGSFFNKLYWFSLCNTIVAILTFITFLLKHIEFDYMSFSYNVLFTSAFLFYFSIKNKRKISLLVSIAAFIAASIAGSRGALLSLLAFLLSFFFLIQNKKNTKKKIAVFVVISCLAAIIIMNFESIVSLLFRITGSQDFDSRILDRIKEGSFFTDKNRSLIYSSVFRSLFDHPIVGHGLFGDIKVVSLNVSAYPQGTYTHNFFLEFLCELGVFFGIICLLCLALYLLLFLRKNKTNNLYDFVIILLCCDFVRLLFSGSYLTSSLFFFMVGLSVYHSRYPKKTVSTNALACKNSFSKSLFQIE